MSLHTYLLGFLQSRVRLTTLWEETRKNTLVSTLNDPLLSVSIQFSCMCVGLQDPSTHYPSNTCISDFLKQTSEKMCEHPIILWFHLTMKTGKMIPAALSVLGWGRHAPQWVAVNLAATCTRDNVFFSETGRHSCYCSAEVTQLCAIPWHGVVVYI